MNGKLRGTKGMLYEGGHRVPFIARWPGHIAAGSENAALMTHMDMLATVAALTGAEVPQGAARDSMNVLPALLGKSQEGRQHAIFHVGGTETPKAVRLGTWKLVPPGGKGYGGGNKKKGEKAIAKPQLYNLEEDLAEQHDLAEKRPEKLLELQALLKAQME
jgi:arylsulfatase A-like enzyme